MNKMQLFCFPYAGGSASFFNVIEKDLPKLELVKPEYSGHGVRHSEPFYRNFDELSDDMFRILKEKYSGGEYALFGYSMGTVTLVEVLKRILADSRMNKPCHVFLAAHEPHYKAEMSGFTGSESDEWIKEKTIKFGAVPEILIHNQSFWRTYLPLYRADYSLLCGYDFEALSLKTEIPATVFYSETDTPRTDMELWKKYFIGECEFYRYDGTHFFIMEHHAEMADMIREKLQGRKVI